MNIRRNKDGLPRFSLGQFYRRHLDPNRLTSEVAILGGLRWRVTKQRGKIIGIERWEPTEHYDPVWIYTLWKD